MRPFDLRPRLTEPVALPGVDQQQATALAEALSAATRLRFITSLSLIRTGKHVYRGTVSPETIARRRGKAGEVRRARAKARRLETVAARSATVARSAA